MGHQFATRRRYLQSDAEVSQASKGPVFRLFPIHAATSKHSVSLIQRRNATLTCLSRRITLPFTERRRAHRFELQSPVIIRWRDGAEVHEALTVSEDISSN